MKHRRTRAALLLAAVTALFMAACASGGAPVTPTPALEVQTPTPAPVQTAEPTAVPEAPADETETGGKTLVVYFSASGNTERMAGYISSALNADPFELVPAEPYTSDDLDWRDETSRVVYEHEHPEAQTVALMENTVENWADYDTVFVGYPIWWGIAAWPVNEFIQSNDFTGKTVIPFCTSSSSGLGESGTLLAGMAETGTWLEGRRFSGGASEADVLDWLNSLELAG